MVESSTDAPAAMAARQDQSGDAVTIDRLELDAPGYAVVYADGDGAPGEQLGVSGLLAGGEHDDVTVELAETAASAVFVVAHAEKNGDEVFDPTLDPSIEGDSGAVSVRLSVNK